MKQRVNGVWQRATQLSSSVYTSDYPQIYPDPLIVAWRQRALVNSGIYQIVYRWKTGTGWTGGEIIDEGNEERDYPQIVCGNILSQDYLFCIFQREITPVFDMPSRKKPLIPPPKIKSKNF